MNEYSKGGSIEEAKCLLIQEEYKRCSNCFYFYNYKNKNRCVYDRECINKPAYTNCIIWKEKI